MRGNGQQTSPGMSSAPKDEQKQPVVLGRQDERQGARASELVTELLHDRSVNCRRSVEERNSTLFGKSANREDGRLVSPKHQIIRVLGPVSFIE